MKDEERLVPHFLAHYERIADSIVVWDNESTDRTVELLRSHPKVEVRTFHTDGLDDARHLEVLLETKEESRGRYDWCIFADADEFLTSSRGWDIRRILKDNVDMEVLFPKGIQILARPEDLPLDWSQSLWEQRKWGYLEPFYEKALLRPETKGWFTPGRHAVFGADPSRTKKEPRLSLIHFDRIDFDHWASRKRRRRSSANIQNGWGWHYDQSLEWYRSEWDKEMKKVPLLREWEELAG